MRFTPLVATWAMAVATMGFAGCLSDSNDALGPEAVDRPPSLDYVVRAPDAALELVEEQSLINGAGVSIYVRVVRPATTEPVPVVAQFTPYTAPGANAQLNALAEPIVDCIAGLAGCESTFDHEFVRRGYAFAYADVRGTGDSTGCLDLRGQADIADAGALTEWLGTQPWSNGKVGFIGASYPGSEAHMAGLADNEHLAAIIPVVASTSFYHYHHNDGVPYNGNHALGGTNTGYTAEGVTPTLNPQYSYAKLAGQAACPHVENAVTHGGLDQTGSYYNWWQERNLRGLVSQVKVPVLMAQGLADWNVKPDHISTWFNELHTAGTRSDAPGWDGPPFTKTIIMGQWGHQYPDDAPDAYGSWWEYATAFFDTFLAGVDTGMFAQDVAWIQDTDGTWHRSASFPLLAAGEDAVWPAGPAPLRLDLHPDGKAKPGGHPTAEEQSWHACPEDPISMGLLLVTNVEDLVLPCDAPDTQLVFETEPFEADAWLSGVPVVCLSLQPGDEWSHIVVVMSRIGADGAVAEPRENYGYLNTRFASTPYRPVTPGDEGTAPAGSDPRCFDLYPQEDVVHEGERLRFTVSSDDDGRTIEAFPEQDVTIRFGPDSPDFVVLPTRPASLLGVRLG